jgi:hypothetical protein
MFCSQKQTRDGKLQAQPPSAAKFQGLNSRVE